VARAKFNAEVEHFEKDAATYRQRGVFLLNADYPTVTLAFATAKTSPPALLVAIRVDFTDYDLRPPSVRFVGVFDDHELTAAEMPTKLLRTVPQRLPEVEPAAGNQDANPDPVGGPAPDPALPLGLPPGVVINQIVPLVQDYGPDTIPFLCLAGVREYHDHPGHSGDPWELHRTTGAGSLARLINVVCTYGLEPITGYSVNLVPQVTFGIEQPPA